MAFSIQGFGPTVSFQGTVDVFGTAPQACPVTGAASAFQTQQFLSGLLGAVQQLQAAYLGILGRPQGFPGQPGFGAGAGFFPGQPGFGAGAGFFPGQPGFGSGAGFFPSQPGFGSGAGFFPSQPGFGTGFFPGMTDLFSGGTDVFGSQPNSFNELLLEIARANGVRGSQQTQTTTQQGQSLPVNVTARAYFDENQQLRRVQTVNIWELNGNNETTFNNFGSNEVFARFNNGVQGRVYRIEVTWDDGRRFQIEGINTTGNVVIDRPNR